MTRAPSEIIRDHVRFTVQPIDAPDERDAILRLTDHLKSDELFLFSTDYPHWQFDGDDALPSGLPDVPVPKDSQRKRVGHLSSIGQGRSCPGGCPMSTVDLERASPAKYKLRVIDCDIHPAMTSWTEVHPYLEKRWIDHLSVYGSHLRHTFSEALSHPRMSPDAARVDAYPEEGGPPGSSLDLMRTQHLDPNGVEVGMLIPLRWNPGSQRNLDFGAALTRAMNTWQIERWVKQEPRLRASMLVAQEDTVAAVAEIDAHGPAITNFAQILMPPDPTSRSGAAATGRFMKPRCAAGLPIGRCMSAAPVAIRATGGGLDLAITSKNTHFGQRRRMQAVVTSHGVRRRV